jgi:hypothetical protein
MILTCLRHRTASCDPANSSIWEMDVRRGIHPPRPIIIARIVLGSALPIDVEIPICTSRVPRKLSWPIQFVANGTWRIALARYGHDLRELTEPMEFDDRLPIGSLDLLCCPPDVQNDLLGIDELPL